MLPHGLGRQPVAPLLGLLPGLPHPGSSPLLQLIWHPMHAIVHQFLRLLNLFICSLFPPSPVIHSFIHSLNIPPITYGAMGWMLPALPSG